MKKPTINQRNKFIYISTIVGLLLIAIVSAFCVNDNFNSFVTWSSHGTGQVMWIFIGLGVLSGGSYLLWQKIKRI